LKSNAVQFDLVFTIYVGKQEYNLSIY